LHNDSSNYNESFGHSNDDKQEEVIINDSNINQSEMLSESAHEELQAKIQ